MKFDRRSPRAWCVFTATACSLGLAGTVARLGRRRGRARSARPRLVLYSHEFSGNVRVLADAAPAEVLDEWDIRFLYLDPRRFRAHDHQRVDALLAMRPDHLLWAARADVLMCTHGLGVLQPLARLAPALRLVDVWHGIGFKDRADYVRSTSGFARHFVPSDWAARFLAAKGVPSDRLRPIGHAAWDPVVRGAETSRLVEKYGVEGDYRARILMAPTWTHEEVGGQRQLFGVRWQETLERLASWAQANNVLVMFRSHLNAGDGPSALPRNIVSRPYARYPLTYELLSITDVLVTDWSSIGSDFLPTGRPILYLDVPPPFPVGYLAEEDRVGPKIRSVDDLMAALDQAVEAPEEVLRAYGTAHERLQTKVLGGNADGKVSNRYMSELRALIDSAE